MKIQSTVLKLNYPSKSIYDFLCTASNYEFLMPEGTTFSSVENAFNFQQNGMPLIAVRLKTAKPTEKIIWETAGGKVDFELSVLIEYIDENMIQVFFHFEGKLNPMLQMMVKKPLTNLLETFIEKLSKQHF